MQNCENRIHELEARFRRSEMDRKAWEALKSGRLGVICVSRQEIKEFITECTKKGLKWLDGTPVDQFATSYDVVRFLYYPGKGLYWSIETKSCGNADFFENIIYDKPHKRKQAKKTEVEESVPLMRLERNGESGGSETDE